MKISPEQIDQSLPAKINTKEAVGLVEEKQEETDSILPPRCDDDAANKRIDKVLDMDYIVDNLKVFSYSVKELIRSFARLVIELEDKIPFYDTIISDDVGGRLVSLFLKRVIDKKKAELNEKSTSVFFIASGRKDGRKNNEVINNFIIENKKIFGRVLVVTEYIETGFSIKSIADKLEEQNIEFDIAALSISPDNNYLDSSDPDSNIDHDLWRYLKKKLKYGGMGYVGYSFSKRSPLGIKKDDNINVHPIKNKEINQSSINMARRDIEFLADEISKLILEKK
jgi:hypothetical protein